MLLSGFLNEWLLWMLYLFMFCVSNIDVTPMSVSINMISRGIFIRWFHHTGAENKSVSINEMKFCSPVVESTRLWRAGDCIFQAIIMCLMEQSPAWQSDRRTLNQELPLRNLTVHYLVHRTAPVTPILSQGVRPNPVPCIAFRYVLLFYGDVCHAPNS
jgi:hypothetical protein